MKRLRKQTLDGNVETLLLSIIQSGPVYGYDIVRTLKKRSSGLLELGEGTVYPVLHRMEEKKLISGSWRQTKTTRWRKYYHLMPKGRKALAENHLQWQMLSYVMKKVLGPVKNLKLEPRLKGAAI